MVLGKQYTEFILFSLVDIFSTGSDWLKFAPFGMRKVLNWIKNNYNNVPVYITENGVSDHNGTVDDDHRIRFLRHYINEVLKGV